MTKEEKYILSRFGYLERMNESRFLKEIYRATVCDERFDKERFRIFIQTELIKHIKEGAGVPKGRDPAGAPPLRVAQATPPNAERLTFGIKPVKCDRVSVTGLPVASPYRLAIDRDAHSIPVPAACLDIQISVVYVNASKSTGSLQIFKSFKGALALHARAQPGGDDRATSFRLVSVSSGGPLGTMVLYHPVTAFHQPPPFSIRYPIAILYSHSKGRQRTGDRSKDTSVHGSGDHL
ncbi:hypothetical protein EVAR_29367_1 [Eumeta japonica]|uniref:Uncharacterized protein n=1 Tax=Eumeta variegata TaxID=151549 RepID=A0A4C1WGU5_EUMVA|nr:hypothetical protein EVAR_29367_1 [Eumeta japonica]